MSSLKQQSEKTKEKI